MWVVRESIIEILNGLMNHRVMHQVVLKVIKLLRGWELTLNEQIGSFYEGTFFSDLLNGITPVK